MSQVRCEFTDTILTSFDDSPHLHSLATFFAINVSKRIKITESCASYGFDCLQDEMSYENNFTVCGMFQLSYHKQNLRPQHSCETLDVSGQQHASPPSTDK